MFGFRADSERGQGKDGSETSRSGDLLAVGVWFTRIGRAINSHDPYNAVEDDVAVHGIHERAEIFEDRAEGAFRYLQVRAVALCFLFIFGCRFNTCTCITTVLAVPTPSFNQRRWAKTHIQQHGVLKNSSAFE